MDKQKSLDAKVQIHRLATRYREISDIPYKSKDEQIIEDGLIAQIKQIVDNIVFINDIDKRDFEDYLQEQLGGNNIDVPEAENPTAVDDLTDVLDHGEPIQQIKEIRQKEKSVKEQIKELQEKKKQLNLLKQKDRLQQEIEKMMQQVADAEKEGAYMTDKKNKEGVVKLRHEKYNKKMDNYKMDKIQAEQLLEQTKDPEQIKIIEESIKLTKKRMGKLKQLKFQVYFQQAMIVIPRKISSITKGISDFSEGMGKMGDGFGQYDKKSSMSSLQVGGSDGHNDFGFNEKSMFGFGKKEKKEPKKRKKRRKKSKRKKK